MYESERERVCVWLERECAIEIVCERRQVQKSEREKTSTEKREREKEIGGRERVKERKEVND